MKWQHTPVFLPEKFHVQRNLAGYSPQGLKESDTTEHMTHNMDITCINPEISFIFLDKLFPSTFFLRSWRLSFQQSIQVIIKVDREAV